MTREEFYKLTDILNSEVLGNFMHGGEADELIAMFEEAVEHSNILEQEEHVSKKKCMLIKDIYTDEDRKVLCEDCEENCKYNIKQEPDELTHSVTKISNQEEPVSDELEKVALEYATHYDKNWSEVKDGYIAENEVEAFKAGANWQEHKDFKLPKVLQRDILDEYAYQCAYDLSNDWMKETPTWDDVETAVKLGAKWKENHLWKPADGNKLPKIDREVIALLDNGTVVFAHRPPEFWDGKNIGTGKVTRYYPKTYDKGCWNIPNVKYWLDVELIKED